MSLQILQMLIRAACADGKISSAEKSHLLKEAKRLSISENNLNFLIDSELNKLNENLDKKNTESGFTTNETLNSGFSLEENTENSGFTIDDNINSLGFQTENNTENSGFTINDNSDDSGFLTDENVEESGFITSDTDNNSGFTNSETEQEISKIENSIFTDIVSLPSQGAMSLVQKAKYHGKWVIIKRIKPEFKDDIQYKELFFKEFENSFHLEHPHLVRIYGKGKDAQGDYYFMEFIDGRPLSNLIGNEGIQDRNLIQKTSLEIVETLDYIHKKQIIHRDLKPDNILITFRGDNAKLIDFGLASADVFEENLQQVGTPKYAAPEQKDKSKNTDGRADIYSFGLILCEMLTGNKDNLGQLKSQNFDLYKIIEKCTQKDASKRFRNCSQLLNELKKIDFHQISENIPQTKSNIQHINNFSQKIYPHPYVTPKEFFTYTRWIWQSKKLDNLHSPFSSEKIFSEKAQVSNYKFFINNYCESIVRKAFEDYHFLDGEYLIKYDKEHFVLTNLRLFLCKDESANFEIFTFQEIENNFKNIQIEEFIYTKTNGFKFWKNDWDLTKKIIDVGEWKNISTVVNQNLKQRKSNTTNKVAANLWNSIETRYSLIPHNDIYDFISFSSKIWVSEEMTKYYKNRFVNHFPEIQHLLPETKEIFEEFIPLKNEYLFLDKFHRGVFTNYRFFYFDNQTNSYKSIPIENIYKYCIERKGIMVSKTVLTVYIKGRNNLELDLKMDSYNTSESIDEKFARIKSLLQRAEYKNLPPETQKHLSLDKNYLDEWWNRSFL